MWCNHSVHILCVDGTSTAYMASFLSSRNLSVKQHTTVDDFVRSHDEVEASCLLMDLHIGEQSGVDVLQQLATRPDAPSVIFMTDSPNVPLAVRAIKAGALEVLEKPLDLTVLLSVVISALERNKEVRAHRRERSELKRRYDRLTKRERQVLPLLLGGWLVKQSAFALGIAEVTLQIHRAQIKRKMEAESLPDLVRMGMKLGIRHANSYPTELATTRPVSETRTRSLLAS